MERRSCHTDRLKQFSFGHCHVSLHTEMLQSLCVLLCVSVCCLQFCKNRWGRASLKCFVDLVKLSPLLSLWLCPFVSLCSTTLMQNGNDSFHWVFFPNGHCSLSVLPPEGLQIYTGNSLLPCNPCFIFVSTFNLSISLFHLALDSCSVVSYKVQLLAPLFGLLCTQLGRLGFLFNKCLFVLTKESS